MSLRLLLATLAVCLGVLASPAAHAKRGIGILNTGDELFEVADLPAKLMPASMTQAPKVGYLCNHFGIFWADVWTWGCKLVVVADEHSYSDLPADVSTQLAADPAYAFGNAKRGFWNHYGILSVLAAVLAFMAYGLLSSKKDDNPATESPAA